MDLPVLQSSNTMRSNRKKFLNSVFVICTVLLLWSFLQPYRELKRRADDLISPASVHKGCKLPELVPDEPTIAKLFSEPSPIRCPVSEEEKSLWENVHFLNGRILFRHKVLDNCHYHVITRKDEYTNDIGEPVKISANDTRVLSDFVRITCGEYTKNLASVTPKFHSSKELSRTLPGIGTGLNVYMMGFDSTSRMNALRRLNNTISLLEKLDGVILEGYNIVGDGTPQALIPILTGQTELELPNTRKRVPGTDFVNVYPWVWKDFAKAGYATLYSEDHAGAGAFTWRLNGFDEQPTHHYYRPYAMLTGTDCIRDQKEFEAHFLYGAQMFTAYPEPTPKFGFTFSAQITHDHLEKISLMDSFIHDEILRYNSSGFLNNTLLIVMSDHGHRFAKIRETHQGQLEERLPLFSFVAPKWFREKYAKAWENMQVNAHRLTTPFDIYSTLKALVEWKDPVDRSGKERSISLWDGIPANRTCADAGIEPHWCTCQQWHSVNSTSRVARDVATALIARINIALEKFKDICAVLRVKRIISVQREAPDDSLMKYKWVLDDDGFVPDFSGNTQIAFANYRVQVEATPGGGEFEASFYYHVKTGARVFMRQISRINKYGDQSHCISQKDPSKTEFCMCRDML